MSKTHVLSPEGVSGVDVAPETVVAAASSDTVIQESSAKTEPRHVKVNARDIELIEGEFAFNKDLAVRITATGEVIRGKIHSSVTVPGGRHEMDIKSPDGSHLMIDFRNGEGEKKKK
jgi:hypothetical protein